MDISKYLTESKIDPKSRDPFYLQIAKIIAKKITDHTLPKGSKLPPERELGNFFGVSRTTAINTYRWLEQEGLVITKVGSGTYVAETAAPRNDAPQIPWSQLFIPYPQTPMSSLLKELVSISLSNELIPLATGMPDPQLYPVDTFKDLITKYISQVDPSEFGYIATEGYHPLRNTIAEMLAGKGINTSSDRILILSGSQQGIYLISKVLLEQGDYVVVQSPTYIGAIQIFQAAGARLLTIPVEDGLNLELLEDYLIRYRPKMFYIIPTYQNPTGRVLTEKERKELLHLAARHRLVIVEDDPYSELYYGERPPRPIKSIDSFDGVVYLSTFSKTVNPGLRTGYLVGHPALINRLALEKQYVDLHSSGFSQWLINLFITHGYLEDHLCVVRNEYKKRRDSLVKAVRRYLDEHVIFNVPDGGFYLWCKIKKPVTSDRLLHEATRCGIFFVPGKAFYSINAGDNEFRLCFATHSEPVLIEGINRLGKAFEITAKNKQVKNVYHNSWNPIV